MLDAERYQRAKSIFFEACNRPVDDRASFVELACADDAGLRDAVLHLLSHDQQPLRAIGDGMGSRPLRDHLERLAGSHHTAMEGGVAACPSHIGRYRILSRLGEGGMGIVYLAEQDNPRRQVALKVIAPGAASRQTLRRFEHEAQILGRLHHPGIAQIYEAGMHDAGDGGQPYFAMELVCGETLTRFCEHMKCDVRERLRLFIAICEAVQHAHQQGVIHRDLKPANILVAAEAPQTTSVTTSRLSVSAGAAFNVSGQPKILDFGVARLTDSDVQATTMHTAADQLIGTVAYMSPEQMSGRPEAIDTRSDVFSLGVILFELLAGRLPHDLTGKSIPDMIRTITDSDPSTLSTINRTYRGDLETIAGKAMEREKSRRYQSAGELAADVRRFLGDEPIHARPPSTLYQLNKFARRNKALVGGAAAVFVALFGGIVTTTWQARQAIAARDEQIELRREADTNADRAEREATKANTVVSALRQMLGSADPHSNKGRDYSVRQMLDEFAMHDADILASEPDVRASILFTMGDAYLSLGELTSAEPLIREALEIRRGLAHEGDSTELADALVLLGWWQHDTGDMRSAEASMREAMDMTKRRAESVDGRELSRREVALGDVLLHLDRLDESLALLETAVQRLRDANDFDSLPTALAVLSSTLAELGRFDEAEELQREVLRLETNDGQLATIASMTSQGNLAMLLTTIGKYQEAERLQREVLEFQRVHLGEEHSRVALAWNNLGILLTGLSRLQEAEECFNRAISIHRAHPEYDQAHLANMLQNLGLAMANQRKFAEAEALIRESVDVTLALRSAHASDLAIRRGVLGDILCRLNRYPEGEALALESLDSLRQSRGESHPATVTAKYRVGEMWLNARKLSEAEPMLREAYDAMVKSPGPFARDTVQAAAALGEVYVRDQRYAEAQAVLEPVVRPAMEALGQGHPAAVRALMALVQAYGRQGKLAEADALVQMNIDWMRTVVPPDDLNLGDAIASLAISLHRQSRWFEAEPLLREAESIIRANGAPQPMTAQMTWRLGAVIMEQSRFAEAEPLLLEGWKHIRDSPDIDDQEKRAACTALIELYKGWNRPDEAQRWHAFLQVLLPASTPDAIEPDGVEDDPPHEASGRQTPIGK